MLGKGATELSHTGQTDPKPTSNRQKSSNSGRDRFTVGIDLVLLVWCRLMFGQTNLSGRNLLNMFERSLPDKLLGVCRLYVGVVSVLLGSIRGRVGLNSATDGRWFVGLRPVMYRAYVGRPDTDSRPIQDRIKSDINTELSGVGRYIPESKLTSARYISNPNRMQTDNVFFASYLHIKVHKKFCKISLHQSGAIKWHF